MKFFLLSLLFFFCFCKCIAQTTLDTTYEWIVVIIAQTQGEYSTNQRADTFCRLLLDNARKIAPEQGLNHIFTDSCIGTKVSATGLNQLVERIIKRIEKNPRKSDVRIVTVFLMTPGANFGKDTFPTAILHPTKTDFKLGETDTISLQRLRIHLQQKLKCKHIQIVAEMSNHITLDFSNIDTLRKGSSALDSTHLRTLLTRQSYVIVSSCERGQTSTSGCFMYRFLRGLGKVIAGDPNTKPSFNYLKEGTFGRYLKYGANGCKGEKPIIHY